MTYEDLLAQQPALSSFTREGSFDSGATAVLFARLVRRFDETVKDFGKEQEKKTAELEVTPETHTLVRRPDSELKSDEIAKKKVEKKKLQDLNAFLTEASKAQVPWTPEPFVTAGELDGKPQNLTLALVVLGCIKEDDDDDMPGDPTDKEKPGRPEA